MTLDGILLNKCALNLKEKLPIRINRISLSSNETIVFNVHCQKERTNLVISTHHNFNRICLSKHNYISQETPNSFVMILRKYLINGVIVDIIQKNYDRYLYLIIKARDELYDERHFFLSVELMGIYANCILVDQDSNLILEALKKVGPSENSKRIILPNVPFKEIEPQQKLNPYLVESVPLDISLVNYLAGFSKLLETEVRWRLAHGENFVSIMTKLKKANELYVSNLTNKQEFHLLPLLHLEKPYTIYPLEEGFDKLFFAQEERNALKQASNNIFRFIKKQEKHYLLKCEKLTKSLNDALNLNEDKEAGQLLFTYQELNKRGLKKITLLDGDGKEITIKLNPRLSIKENALKYFQIYQKKRKGKCYIEEQLLKTQKEKEYFAGLNEQLEIANLNDINLIKQELFQYKYLSFNKKHPKAKTKPTKIKIYQIKYLNQIIYFGKNNLQNDYLTFKLAKKNWYWFHTKDYHGSHVVFSGEEINENIIRFCANLAAYYSKGRYSSSVPVNYCQIKSLKKIKGAKAGYVALSNYKTIYIDPKEVDLPVSSI